MTNNIENVLYSIFWDELGEESYLYGSDIKFLTRHCVRFENPMMPSGTPIKEWESFTHFQADRHEPQLPLLTPGESYVFRAFYRDYPRGTVFFRIIFFDRQNKRIHSFIIREKKSSFVCPEHAFRYTVQLVQGGADKLIFGHIELCREECELLHGVAFPDEEADELHIFVPSQRGRVLRFEGNRLPEGIANAAVVSGWVFGFLKSEQRRLLRELGAQDFERVSFHCADEAAKCRVEKLLPYVKNGNIMGWDCADDE